jgi:putative nucleotidyltransferase with HDIG domain
MIEQPKEKIESNPNKIEKADILSARLYLDEIYRKEFEEKRSKIEPEVLEANLQHTFRVIKNARSIAQAENMDINKIDIAATLHDIGKLRHDLAGGIDTFGHHETGAKLAKEFLINQLKKSPELAESISQMITRHSDIPFIRRVKPDIPEAETKEDFVLRDADVLDMISIHGLKKIVEIRQNPQSKFYSEDEGKLDNAISSALQSSKESEDILVTAEAKKIAKEYQQQTEEFLKIFRRKKKKFINYNLNAFKDTFYEVVKDGWAAHLEEHPELEK